MVKQIFAFLVILVGTLLIGALWFHDLGFVIGILAIGDEI